MTTRTSQRWETQPGSFDTTKSTDIFPSSNRYGIPDMAHTPIRQLPAWLSPYRQRIRSDQPPQDGAVHFFLDDYRFESTWTHPGKALRYLDSFSTLLTPDFSLYANMPVATQIWNTFRNRWLGCYWQRLGYTVIPTISWSLASSFDFAFLGVPQHSLVALSNVGIRTDLDAYHFADGYHNMIDAIAPSAVLVYGTLPEDLAALTETHFYPTRWTNIRSARHGRTR